MRFITLNNGISMPLLGLGTWDLRGEAGKQTIIQALQVGYRLIDTARMYGNEVIVGQAIIESGIPRQDIFITTKLESSCQGYQKAKQGIEKSLKDLQTDYIDLLLIHEPYTQSLEMYEAMKEAYHQGKVRAIGISNFQGHHYDWFIEHCGMTPAVHQIESHVYHSQLKFKQRMEKDGVQMESWASFTEGRKDIFHEPVLTNIGKKYRKSAAQIALTYLIQNGIVVIPKTSHKERMIENMSVFDFELSDDDKNLIQTLDQGQSLFHWYD